MVQVEVAITVEISVDKYYDLCMEAGVRFGHRHDPESFFDTFFRCRNHVYYSSKYEILGDDQIRIERVACVELEFLNEEDALWFRLKWL